MNITEKQSKYLKTEVWEKILKNYDSIKLGMNEGKT